MPVIKTSQAMKPLASGQTLEVIASDRGALSDIPAWAKDMGHALKEQFEENEEYHFIVEKG
jgi:TusA-related sulfurtransferase